MIDEAFVSSKRCSCFDWITTCSSCFSAGHAFGSHLDGTAGHEQYEGQLITAEQAALLQSALGVLCARVLLLGSLNESSKWSIK